MTTMKQPDLGKKIAELRKTKGLTQEEVIQRCNINVRTLQRIEAGEVTPRYYTIKLILEALEQDMHVIENIHEEIAAAHLNEYGSEAFQKKSAPFFDRQRNIFKKSETIIAVASIIVILAIWGIVGSMHGSKSNFEKDLIGRWELKAYYDNGKLTPTMNTRRLVFTKDMKFESSTLSGVQYNAGIYATPSDSIMLTVHHYDDYGLAPTSNEYHYKITSDTLHLKGYFMKRIGQNHYITSDVDEIWVRVTKDDEPGKSELAINTTY